ncbi:MAG TPA: hypothetical protein VIL01_10520 [Thermomicrobiales bacterium]
MNVVDGLQIIRDRLVENDAHPATLKLVDEIIRRASLPAAQQASAPSLLHLTRMLMRRPEANSDTRIYNDLALLEEQLDAAAAAARERRAAEEARPIPKPKKYYRQLREREKKAAQ